MRIDRRLLPAAKTLPSSDCAVGQNLTSETPSNPQYNAAAETKEQITLRSIEEYGKRGIKYKCATYIFLEVINGRSTCINIPENYGIDSLPDYLYLPKLKKLYCNGSRISSLDGLNAPKLQTLYCSRNKLTSIPDAVLRSAEYINATDNRLSLAEIKRIMEFKAQNRRYIPLVLNLKDDA